MWLQDGTILGISSTLRYRYLLCRDTTEDNENAIILIDLNSDKKPNKWGKDLYMVKVTPRKNGNI